MEILPHNLLVLDDTSHALLLIDGPSGEIISEMTYPAGFSPTELTLTSDFSKAYIPVLGNKDNGAILVANLLQRSIYRLPIKIPQPTQFALSPTGLFAYFSDPSGTLYALDLQTMSLKGWDPPLNAACVGLAADQDLLYSVWENKDQGSLIVFDLNGQLLTQHEIPGIPTNIILDKSTNIYIPFTTTDFNVEGILFFNKTSENDVTTITNVQRCIYPYSTSPSAAYPSHIAIWAPNNLAYVVNEENSSITVVDSTTAAILRHIEIGRSISCLHILPGGDLGIATSHQFADLCMIDLQNGRLLSTTNTKREILGYMAVIPTS